MHGKTIEPAYLRPQPLFLAKCAAGTNFVLIVKHLASLISAFGGQQWLIASKKGNDLDCESTSQRRCRLPGRSAPPAIWSYCAQRACLSKFCTILAS